MSIAVRVSGGHLKYARRLELVGFSQQGVPPPLAKTNNYDQAKVASAFVDGARSREQCLDAAIKARPADSACGACSGRPLERADLRGLR